MKHKYYIRYLLWALIILAFKGYTYAQTTVNINDVSTLSVEAKPNTTYSWEIYDSPVSNFATVNGNCPSSKASFVNGQSTGHSVEVEWLETGTYFFKVTETSDCSNNIKIGKVIVEDPLPIQLYSFEVQQQADSVLLEWISKVEINNDYYTLYKSEDAINWSFFREIEGAGNSSIENIYRTFDTAPHKPITYYKLTQTDFDGTHQELGIRYITINDPVSGQTTTFVAYPNPTNGITTIKGHFRDLSSLKVINVIGVDLTSKVSKTLMNPEEIQIDLGHLAVGVYLIYIDGEIVKIIKR